MGGGGGVGVNVSGKGSHRRSLACESVRISGTVNP